jgi:transglutaminase-like putative cysteine protease
VPSAADTIGSDGAEVESFAAHSSVTEPGRLEHLLDDLPSAVDGLAAVVRNLVVHQDRVPAELLDARRRHDEPRTRRVASMLSRIHELDPRPLTEPRDPAARLVGHCRTSSVLLTAFLRHQGTPARPRCGFSVYYAGGREFYGDHWVTEHWVPGDAADPAGAAADAAGWQLADAELDDETMRDHGMTFDPLDVPRSLLLLAGTAWQRGRADPDGDSWRWFGAHPDDTGRTYVAGQLLRDAACLVRREPGAFDSWLPGDVGDHLGTLDRFGRAHLAGRLVPLRTYLGEHRELAVPTAALTDVRRG